MSRATHEQKLVDDSTEIESCEELRERLLDYAQWLSETAEALRHPITRCKTMLVPPPPNLPHYLDQVRAIALACAKRPKS